MELPILQLLPGPLPMDAIRIITQFLRKPHPTAEMIKALEFVPHQCGFALLGATLRFHQVNTYPPRYIRGPISEEVQMTMVRWFEYDEDTGEPEIDEDDGGTLTVNELRTIGISESDLVEMGYIDYEDEEL